MVFNGRLSTGCENCRKLHTRCDENRPSCSRCVRTKMTCTGYREQVDLIFRPSYVNTKKKSLARKEEVGVHEPVAHSHATVSPDLRVRAVKDSLSLSRTTLESLTDADRTRCLHLQLPNLLSQSRPGSVLNMATQAISLAMWARSRPGDVNASRSSRSRYAESLAIMSAALRDPERAIGDDTLYAVLLLSGYETITFDADALCGWGAHVDGATSLLKSRGKENFSSPFSCSMFLFIRRTAIQNRLQTCKPMDPVFLEYSEILSHHESLEDQLLSKAMRIPSLQSSANDLLLQSDCDDKRNTAAELIQSMRSLDSELIAWARRIPARWSYTANTVLESVSGPILSNSIFVPTQIYRYSSYHAARVWNLYRVYRIIIQSILDRISSLRLESEEQNHNRRSIYSTMVSGICASVPFLLGYDISGLKRLQSLNVAHLQDREQLSLWPQSFLLPSVSHGPMGKFSLIWPLYVASSVSDIPRIQQKWMRAQLKWIAQTGEAHARCVEDVESQILSGRPEIIAFDCV